MIVVQYLKKLFTHIIKVSGPTIGMLCVAHYVISYWMFFALDETTLTDSHNQYFYFWVVTSSTVGYGDASPTTDGGRLFAALFFIPFSLMLFTLVIARMGSALARQIRRSITGMNDFHSLSGHILIMGYDPLRTQEFVSLILADKHRVPRTILVVTDHQDVEHPFLETEGVEFCKVASLKDAHSMERIALKNASKIIIDDEDDNACYVYATRYAHLNPDAHITAHIKDEDMASYLEESHPNIEVIVDNTEEIMVRCMQDNGSSRMLNQLLRSDQGHTLYTGHLNVASSTSTNVLRAQVRNMGGLLLGMQYNGSTDISVDPQDENIAAGDHYFYYLAQARIDKITL